ncbi:NAD+ diphosphatase [Ruaniaceae bacterium KH17]|nr:NAD+ diphosphatase [Ruaniaceae bacterium KH17]
MFLDLPLARAVLDASTPERAHPELIAELLADPGTRTLHMDAEGGIAVDDEGLVIGTIDGPREPGQIAVFLGRPLRGSLLEGDAYVLLIDEPIEGLAYRNTRATALALTEPERGLAVAASAIANWHRFYTHCGGCGTETNVVNSGWVRLCPACSTEHYPRTDPAVIMTIHDANDRVLLAHASHFPQKRYSLLAGYLEPGESLESAVVRETLEEVQLRVTRVEYRGSQAWPFPRSLMLAFDAWVEGTPEPIVDGEEITEARFYSREELARAVADGDLLLPGEGSAARGMLEEWNGAPF